MANEKRLIDAIELANFFGFMRKMWSGSEIMNVIHEAETVDAVEVVRCKDCRRCGVYTSGNLYCTHPNGLADPKPDDFCSYGEGREGE